MPVKYIQAGHSSRHEFNKKQVIIQRKDRKELEFVPTNDWNPESKFYQERIDHSLLVVLTKTWIRDLNPVPGIWNYLPNLLSFLNSGGVDNLPFSVSGLLSFSASWYRALLFPYLLTHLVIYDACFQDLTETYIEWLPIVRLSCLPFIQVKRTRKYIEHSGSPSQL